MRPLWSALARQRFKAERTVFKSTVKPAHPKWLPTLIAATMTMLAVADDLSQRYEKAYFLETAKGQTEEALELYKQIVATDATDETRQTIIQSLKRMLMLHERQRDTTLQSKVDHFIMQPLPIDRIIETFGEPENYFGYNQTYTRDTLPESNYTMVYPDAFSIAVSGGIIFELRFEKPLYSIGGITIGSSLEDVLAVFPPDKIVSNVVNRSESGVVYKDRGGSISYKTKQGARFTIIKDKVYSLNIYNTALLKAVQSPRTERE